MSIFTGVSLTPADLPQAPGPSQNSGASGAGSTLEFYGPGASGGHALPNANGHAEVSPVFGGEGPG
jgi:hypothetical protein